MRYELISINLRAEDHLDSKALTNFFGENIPDIGLSFFGTYTYIILWRDEFGLIIKGI